jgi:hypothetical protein
LWGNRKYIVWELLKRISTIRSLIYLKDDYCNDWLEAFMNLIVLSEYSSIGF